VVFLINGFPVFIVEAKSANKIDGIAEALDQIRRYHHEAPEIMAILQMYTLTHLIRYYYGATWNTSRKGLFNWKKEQEGDYETLVKSFFDKERVIRIIDDFILFTRQDDELKKVVLRPHQMRAVQRIVARAGSDKKRGLIWHTQGSGKTYSMIVAAKEIIENPSFDNPTVIMLVDRNELESQLFGNLTSVGFLQDEIEVKSKKDIQQLLKEDKRGLIVSMIHKFDGIEPNINTRDNIFVLVDEAHRTTGGKLGNYLMGALPNATYIGFTGTPIDRTSYGSGTFIREWHIHNLWEVFMPFSFSQPLSLFVKYAMKCLSLLEAISAAWYKAYLSSDLPFLDIDRVMLLEFFPLLLADKSSPTSFNTCEALSKVTSQHRSCPFSDSSITVLGFYYMKA